MKFTAAVAHTAWLGSSVPAWRKLNAALYNPAAAQRQILQELLHRNAESAYGREYGFSHIRTYQEFAGHVPLIEYETISPWVKRIQGGESAVLTKDPVTHLLPTSGSGGARKLIPFTGSLQRNFNAAIGPWMVDLWRQHPVIALGPAYWSVTPAGQKCEEESSAVPIGFHDDSKYLGGMRQRFVEAVLAAPSALSRIERMDTFFHATLLCLLREPDLRFISVWHPSFLCLLLQALPTRWDALLGDLRDGEFRFDESLSPSLRRGLNLRRCSSRRFSELVRAGPERPEALWRQLRLISCWASDGVDTSTAELRRWFPNTTIQPKGLLATEAVVTLPFARQHPLAVRSHFFEFIDERGDVHLVEGLQKGQVYEVVVTTGGGLWRYRLKDQIEVTGFVHRTPSCKFLGRGDSVSDLYGEKLSEVFIAGVLQEVSLRLPRLPSFIMIAPEKNSKCSHYTLYIEGEIIPDLISKVEFLLRKNPHYAYCRDLGQLEALRLFQISGHAQAAFLAAEHRRGLRLGDIKPRLLSRATDWSSIFTGAQAS